MVEVAPPADVITTRRAAFPLWAEMNVAVIHGEHRVAARSKGIRRFTPSVFAGRFSVLWRLKY
jgi:hypothetical protein